MHSGNKIKDVCVCVCTATCIKFITSFYQSLELFLVSCMKKVPFYSPRFFSFVYHRTPWIKKLELYAPFNQPV